MAISVLRRASKHLHRVDDADAADQQRQKADDDQETLERHPPLQLLQQFGAVSTRASGRRSLTAALTCAAAWSLGVVT